jgi:hypothetical protein
MRFARQLRGATAPEAHAIIQTPPGEEGQVDYGDGPMVRHPGTGKYRRTRLFLLTLGYSRKSVHLLTWHSSTRIWAELHLRRRAGPRPDLPVCPPLPRTLSQVSAAASLGRAPCHRRKKTKAWNAGWRRQTRWR